MSSKPRFGARVHKYHAKPQWICTECGEQHSSKRPLCSTCKTETLQHFASKGEAGRYQELRLALLAGAITDLELHPRYPLKVYGAHVAIYEADFRYKDGSGKTIIEDFKGVQTPVFKIKRKLLEALYDVKLTLVK